MLGRDVSFEERAALAGGPLAALTASLAADLDRLLPDEDVFIPPEKARMTRKGGRCERDGTFLEFDPTSPRRHRCPACGTMFDDETHYRWWIMGYQLWLAERAVHASALARLTGLERYRRLGEAILLGLVDRYPTYPNEDNVLGPTRVFFSTYLESIWTLQLAVAVWLLEDVGSARVGGAVRDEILAPSSELIAEFNEGLSNRQVWNSAALGATGVLLDRRERVEDALAGPGGLEQFLRTGLLGDGTWYEGENYHLFAHRGLWYLVMLAEWAGYGIRGELRVRFDAGFVAPLLTALPDLTFPARRDSQYRASLRQWRVAESLELGLARAPDSVVLAGGLGRLYADAPAGDSARWRSTAEAERNVPGVRLTRADLGWKSLLFALLDVPKASAPAPRSALMEGQGFGVIRRDDGRLYVALDYGHTGGSHGHPDRLNFWLINGDDRVFEDVGTGSYVEQTLHWYRSTLAHNAPLIDGRSQNSAPGALRAWDKQGSHAWIDAESFVAPEVLVRRSVVVGPGYVIDQLEWNSDRDVTLDLPMHLDAEIEGADWKSATLTGGRGLEDGFDFLGHAECCETSPATARVRRDGIHGTVVVDAPHEWWRARAPGPPGQEERRFLLVHGRGAKGLITSAWSWTGAVDLQRTPEGRLEVSLPGGRAQHARLGDTWHVQPEGEKAMTLDGRRKNRAEPRTTVAPNQSARPERVPLVRHAEIALGDLSGRDSGLRFELGESNYRRTESTWAAAGSPKATVNVAAAERELLIEVSVIARDPHFAAKRAENPLDNEHPDVNSDGVQIHVACPGHGDRMLRASWLMVPEPGRSTVRVSTRDDAARIPLDASWRRTNDGWQLLARIARSSIGPADARFGLDVIVNEMPVWRERRRGQLVMSADRTGWAWLRGDHQDVDSLIPMTVRNG
jgi:hypothetical protein